MAFLVDHTTANSQLNGVAKLKHLTCILIKNGPKLRKFALNYLQKHPVFLERVEATLLDLCM